MKCAFPVCAALLLLASPAAAASKIIGHWHLVKGDCAQRAFTFTDGKEIVDETYPGFAPSHSTYPVSYNDGDPKETYVLGTGGQTGFKFLAPNRVLMDTSNFCEYARP